MKLRDVLVISAIVLLDLITKQVVASNMRLYQSIEVIQGFFRITYATNTGAAWSMLSGQMVFFYIITVIALVVMVSLLMKTQNDDLFQRAALWLLLAGTLGNFYDRVVFQYVRDFLDFTIFGYDFPIFNVADISLTLGVGVILLETLLSARRQKHGNK